jgi:chromosome segregation ATPase
VVYEKQILNALWRIERRLEILMSQQDEINADVTELDAAVTAIQAEITQLQQANPGLDLTALKTAVDAVAGIAPAAPPASGG